MNARVTPSNLCKGVITTAPDKMSSSETNDRVGWRVLAVTSLPCSEKNAIGVQTLHFSGLWSKSWSHCYLDDSLGPSLESVDSRLLKSSIPRLWPFKKGRGLLTRTIEALGLCWWQGNSLTRRKRVRLAKLYQGVTYAYVAPLRSAESAKCLEIVRTLGVPYAVHLWDVLDTPSVIASADYKALIKSADHVFCLSSRLHAEVRRYRSGRQTSILGFTRPVACAVASPPTNSALALAVTGFLCPYVKGLELLEEAVETLKRHFETIKLVYCGTTDQFALLPESLKKITSYNGFVDSRTRDELLATCHFGYVPGTCDNKFNPRERYSVPSRISDFFSIGLPVLSSFSNESATAEHFRQLAETAFRTVTSAEELVSVIISMREPSTWNHASTIAQQWFGSNMELTEVLRRMDTHLAHRQ